MGAMPRRCDVIAGVTVRAEGLTSPGARKAADTAAHLVDRVLPEAPYRQWVLTFPWEVRFLLAMDRKF
ncbi:MAG: hypothetical protein ABIK09_00040, partial [Pseudomonadota bacterium]